MGKMLSDEFKEYMSRRYGAKGRRSIRFCCRPSELDILLGVRDAPDFDDEDKKYLNNEQLDELGKLSRKSKDAKVYMEKKTHMTYEDNVI